MKRRIAAFLIFFALGIVMMTWTQSGTGGGGQSNVGGGSSGTAFTGGTVTSTIFAPNGALATPAYSFTNSTSSGMYYPGSSGVALATGSNGAPFIFEQPNTANCTITLGVSFGCTNSAEALGSAASPFTSVFGEGFFSKGTTFTSNAGCSETTLTGGATAGSFHTGTASTCTIIVTMGNSMTATNGWSCSLWDTTTTATVLKQTAFGTTTASFTLTTPGNGDVIIFSCIGF